MNNPLVSVVIPTHNRKQMIVRLVTSLLENTYKNIEIIIVDDASSDGTSEKLSKMFTAKKKITVIRNKRNLFTAGSRNVGAKNAKGDYIFFIDDDNVVDKKIIEKLVEVFLLDPKLGELAPVNYSFNNPNKILWAGTNRNMTTSFTNQRRNLGDLKSSLTWESDDAPNAFMIRTNFIKKHAIRFREMYGIMYEESDYAYRIREAGYTIKVVRDAKIYHDAETSEKGEKSRDYMYHFMSNPKRPFVTARNRIIFHSQFSTTAQLVGIIIFWNWIFAAYYAYKMLFYSGAGDFSLVKRVRLVLWYIWGTFAGIIFVAIKKRLE